MGEVEESSTSLNSKSRPKKLLFPPKIFRLFNNRQKETKNSLRSVCRQKKVKKSRRKKEEESVFVCFVCLLSPTTTVTFTTTNTLPPEPNAILT
jgi:hypothetical protein